MAWSSDEMMAGDDAPSYRQLDHWTRLGLLKTVGESTPGSGHSRRWAHAERDVSRLIRRLTRTGLELRYAHDIARRAEPVSGVPVGGTRAEITSGVWVLIDCAWE